MNIHCYILILLMIIIIYIDCKNIINFFTDKHLNPLQWLMLVFAVKEYKRRVRLLNSMHTVVIDDYEVWNVGKQYRLWHAGSRGCILCTYSDKITKLLSKHHRCYYCPIKSLSCLGTPYEHIRDIIGLCDNTRLVSTGDLIGPYTEELRYLQCLLHGEIYIPKD